MIDLSKIHNPYDFANPVSDSDLFAGRKKELEEICYYLDHAITSQRPINIAILGPRASGKTSLLNMCEIEAQRRNFYAVRIDLDEDDAKTQLCFFYKIFDSVLTAVCEKDVFGGLCGKTYDTYLDIVYTYKIPDDKFFCPFIFPFQYAKAMSSGNVNVQISDNTYKRDLRKIRDEAKAPIILLFDEGNVLANSRVHLEKLRNIFMNIPGYMLVFTGTKDLFPIMDEVFSPIVRQFKKITIGEFEEKSETEDCIKKPLKKINVNPGEVFDLETYSQLHNISEGRPYEIQLICHMLFRRIQTKRADKMKLDLSVLEEVRKELETSQDISSRPILMNIKSFGKLDFKALDLLCTSEGYASFKQIWAIENIINGEKHWTEEKLNKKLDFFIQKGIIKLEKEKIRFAGDDFDRIYTKYYAREQGVHLNFPQLSLETCLHTKLIDKLKTINGLAPIMTATTDLDFDLEDTLKKMATNSNIYVEKQGFVKNLYDLMIENRRKDTLFIIGLEYKCSWLKIKCWYYAETQSINEPIYRCVEKVKDMDERAKKFEAKLKYKISEVPVISVKLLADNIVQTSNERFRNILALDHLFKAIDEYVESKNYKESLFHASLSYKYNSNPRYWKNNLGYIFLSAGELDKAKDLLEQAITERGGRDPLPIYNLAVLEAKLGNFGKSLEKIKLCIKKAENIEKEEREAICLFLPQKTDSDIIFKEIKDCGLLETAKEAKRNLEDFLSSCQEK